MAIDGADGVAGAEIPVFDLLVPAASYEDGACVVGDVDEARGLDGCVVLGDDGGGAGGYVEEAGVFISAGSDDFGSILRGSKSMISSKSM